ncbi:erythromycin esterase [Nocardia seriolae]|uniref:Erythromycin esterase n=1 Tax=Nocardia seriolae TaxID=37332 RepID=A0ABC9Z775_9NOCA|nr:hypothetical protein NS07_v2contig00317-0001 [Nocardia seriolae]GAP33534.1 erythromycin esterase [Nocardia seriolae]
MAPVELVRRAEAAGDVIALHCARGAQGVLDFFADGMHPGPGRNLRREVMAANLAWILEREDRVLFTGHNAHLQRTVAFGGAATVAGWDCIWSSTSIRCPRSTR